MGSEEILIALITSGFDEWSTVENNDIKLCLKDATSIMKSFNVQELKCIFGLTKDIKSVKKMLKFELANEVSKLYGDISVVESKSLKSP